jgi:hypothetical protein
LRPISRGSNVYLALELTWIRVFICMAKSKEIEFVSDAWRRFERAVDVVAKSPPQHRTKKTAQKKRKKRR